MFWESVNAIGVRQGPAVISIWDDGYGISVPNEHQIAKATSRAARRLPARARQEGGFDVYRVRGWALSALENLSRRRGHGSPRARAAIITWWR